MSATRTRRATDADARRLRSGIRDLVALSTMSAWWIGRSPADIAESLCGQLVRMVRADGVRVQLRDPEGGPARLFTTDGWPAGAEPVTVPIGLEAELGQVELMCRRPGFPTELELVLIQTATNHVCIALRYTALLRRHEQAEAEREELLAQTRAAVAARERAVSIVSHDLGNPLSTVQICVNALLDREPPSVAGTRDMAEIIQRSAAWMQQIVQDLLDRTSLEAGRLVLHRQPTAVSEVIGAAQVMFVPMAQDHGLQFLVQAADDLPAVDVDSGRLLQVLSNLLGNAIKFTSAGGRVVLSACVDGSEIDRSPRDWVRFQVTDTGPGIAPEDQDHVFDWLWHGERPGRNGTGLGLAIAAGLVEAHGGRLNVESELHRGSTFWFALPASGGLA